MSPRPDWVDAQNHTILYDHRGLDAFRFFVKIYRRSLHLGMFFIQ